MAALLLAGPTGEPITLAEAKTYMKIDVSEEDGLIQTLITAARLHVEALAQCALMTQSWRLVRDAWPRGRVLQIPIGPVQEVREVRVYDDKLFTVSPESYIVEVSGIPARLTMRRGYSWPRPGRDIAGIEIDFIAGYGSERDDVPACLRQALLLLVSHWFTHREPVVLGDAPLPIPGTVDALLERFKRTRL